MIHPDSHTLRWIVQNGFSDVKLVERTTPHNVPKTHAKFFYQATYVTNTETGCILLDVLFEDIYYHDIEQLPIQSRFLKLEGEPVLVNVPSKADMLGDKLTALDAGYVLL